jgi:preprotein translocase subunit SecA
MSILSKIFGDPNEKIVKSLQPIVDKINNLESAFQKMNDEELKNVTNELKSRIINHELSRTNKDQEVEENSVKILAPFLDKILPEAFAAVREASRRATGQRHYDVQLIGGIILHRGQIAEMRTGEGKTLVATLPLYLNALAGQGAHLVTVNDYLSRVGAGWMSPVYHALGMSVGVIVHEAAFIYDPNYTDETQFDDRLKRFRPVNRREAYGCDITYGTNNEFGFDYLRDNMAPSLEKMVQRDLYYSIVDEVDSILIDEARTPLIISAPREEGADKYYQFAELIGRLKENEDYNIDEKMRASTLTEAGIAKMEKFLGVENIYTAGGMREVHHIEQALKAHTLFKLDRDYVVREGEVIIVDEFTGRLMFGRRYSEGLHQAIEAKEKVKIQRESETLATITFQNYFRMYKKLSGMTGTAVTEAEEFSKIYNLETIVIPTHRSMVRRDMNDLIYSGEKGKFQAVIEDVKARHEKGQPVLIGTISIEKNEILAEMMEREGLRPQVLNAKNHEKEAQIIADAGKVNAITIATNMAGRGVDIMLGGVPPSKLIINNEKLIIKEGNSNTENILEKENNKINPEFTKWKEGHDKVVEFGGLHVIGTERHESRRIDNQLRGRAGRQGDPGSSQFYISTEDDLMRIFGGDRMKSIMAALRLPEDVPIENKIISRSIESAQKKVEGNNFDIRKHLVEYDDVLNKHRTSIYNKRKEILNNYQSDNSSSDNKEKTDEQKKYELSNFILEMVENEIEQVVTFHTAGEKIEEWNFKEIAEVMKTIFPVEDNLLEKITTLAQGGTGEKNYNKLDQVAARTNIIEYLFKSAKENYDKIKIAAGEVKLNWSDVEKSILLHSIDTLWIEHLDAISALRQGIGLRGYGQRDPLVEYKKEAFRLFNELNSLIQKEVVYSIFKVFNPSAEKKSIDINLSAKSPMEKALNFTAPIKGVESSKLKVESNKVGRNDLCPCGSGKKFKKCCGK